MSLKKDYIIKLDIQRSINNEVMKFDDIDKNVNSFKIHITRASEILNLTRIKGTLYSLFPNGQRLNIPMENRGDYFYISLPKEFTEVKGLYLNELSMVRDNKRVTTDTFKYEVI